MTEAFHNTTGRSNWNQDRGECPLADFNNYLILTGQDLPMSDNRRTSFGDVAMAGSLITGSNESILKA